MTKEYSDYMIDRIRDRHRLAGHSPASMEALDDADKTDYVELRAIMPNVEGLNQLAHRILQELRDAGCTIRQARQALRFVDAALEHQPVVYPDVLVVGNRRLYYGANSASSAPESSEASDENGSSASMEKPL